MPAFSQQAMKGYHEMMLDIATQLVQKWQRTGRDEEIEVAEDMTKLTLDTIGLCGFDFRFNSFYKENQHPFIESMLKGLNEAMEQSGRLPIADKLMIKRRKEFDQHVDFMKQLVDDIIQERRKQDKTGDDLLSLMLHAEDPETGERLSDENIRYQIITFLIAGHETTSGLLSFAIYFLLKNPEKLKKAVQEADEVLQGGLPTFKQVQKLSYTRMVLNEALRLWPTAPTFSLYAKEDTVIGENIRFTRIKVSLFCSLNYTVIQRYGARMLKILNQSGLRILRKSRSMLTSLLGMDSVHVSVCSSPCMKLRWFSRWSCII